MSLVSKILSQPGDRIAVIAGSREISYAELAADIHRASTFLRSEGLAGATIGIHVGPPQSESDYANWVAHLAALRIGATHISIVNAEMLESALALAGLDALVGKAPDGAAGKLPRVVPFELTSLPEAEDSPDDEAKAVRLNLTSGTTGEPKLVRWDAKSMEQRVDQASDVGTIGKDTVLGMLLNLRTTAGFRYPLATWGAGGRVILANRVLDTNSVTNIIRSNLLLCSPFQLGNIVRRSQPWPNRERRTIAVLGGRIPSAMRKAALAKFGNEVLVSYGSTETGNIAHGDASLADRHPGAVGSVRDGVELRIVGANGKPLPPGEIGRIQVRTPVMGAADKRKKAPWFETGDLGVLFEDGLLALEGRDADVVNVSGMKIGATDIEARLKAIPGIADAAISVFETPVKEVLAIALVREPDHPLDDLFDDLRPVIPNGAEFHAFLLNEIPRNDMGKVDRPRLAEAARDVLQRTMAKTRVDA